MDNQAQKELVIDTSLKSIIINMSLSGIKLFAGITAHSAAMVSDAIHSAADVFSTFVVLVGVNISGKESDKNHPYGHERLECVAAILLAAFLCFTGLAIGYDGILKISKSMEGTLVVPGQLALIVAMISIPVKEYMFRYSRKVAKIINSGALMADAWHHRTDALASLGSFIGVFGARLGYPVLDPAASLIICTLIIKSACNIFIDAINKMADCSCDDETITNISKIITSQEGVLSLDSIKTRLFGAKINVDIEIGVDKTLTIDEAHNVAHKVEYEIICNFKKVKHCMVHVNPVDWN